MLQFLDQLRPLLPRNDNAVIAKLTRKFFATSLAFQRNTHTVKLLNHYINRIRTSPSKVYVILLELKRKLSKYEPSTNEVCFCCPHCQDTPNAIGCSLLWALRCIYDLQLMITRLHVVFRTHDYICHIFFFIESFTVGNRVLRFQHP